MMPAGLKITLNTREARQVDRELERMFKHQRRMLWLSVGGHSLLVFLGALLGGILGARIGG
jgi:hypothetical protein